MNFKDIYEKSLKNAKTTEIDAKDYKSSKPIMVSGIISPDTKFVIQPNLFIKFSLDKKGMDKVIDMFESVWNTKSDTDKKSLFFILSEIYNITEEYLGGRVIPALRQGAYSRAKGHHLTLSQIEGKKIGACTERSAIAHQLLVILEKAGVIHHESYFTNSRMTTDTSGPHSFVILISKNDPSKKYLYDIENPIEFIPKNEINSTLGVGLYHMTEEEYQDFVSGKSISPKSIFEGAGMKVINEKRYFGNGECNQELDMEK